MKNTHQSRMFITHFLLLAAVALSVVSTAYGNTINAVSCSQADVQSAIDSAQDGDTVLVPAGTSTWTIGITVNKGITLKGAGIDQTVIVDNTPYYDFIMLSTIEGNFYRLTGFTFRPGTVTKSIKGGGRATVNVTGQSKTVRIDHNKFDGHANKAISIIGGFVFGVIDRNEFFRPPGGGSIAVEVFHSSWNGVGSRGDASWADDSHWGTEKFVFIEDNKFWTADGSHYFTTDSQDGGRYVFRYNTVTNGGGGGGHGTESGGRSRGARAAEVYGNTYSHTTLRNLGQIRSGTGVFFNNVATGKFSEIWPPVNNRSYGGFGVWPPSDGASPYDLNDGIIYDSGVHDGPPASATLVDTQKNWKVNFWSEGGYSVHNVTKNLGSHAVSNTSNSFVTRQSAAGQNVSFDPGDRYQILRVQLCMDQIGRGKGDLLSGQDAVPKAWPNQVSDPMYQWNNTINGKIANWSESGNPHLALGRDFINAVKPGYKPYTYPHPLTLEPTVEDSDGDRLLDIWEIEHFGSISDPRALPDLDVDGDGLDNLSEQTAGTSPVDSSSRLVITDQRFISPTNFQIQWASTVDKTYDVQVSTTMTNWSAVTNMMAITPTTTWTDTGVGAGNKFYRVRIR
jgi:hypothetical protein